MIRKKIVSITVFLIILFCFANVIYNILSFKYGDGILSLKYFYEQENNTVDLLVLGSSHAFEDINTSVLYEQFGISTYVLAGSIQPFWNSYYYLKEALKTQSPQLVVLEGYAAAQRFDYSDHSRIIKNNLGIKGISDRIESITVSSPPEKIDDYIFSYRLWHSRYEEINESDFGDFYEKPLYKYYKGFGVNFNTQAYECPDVDSFQGTIKINAKEESYFRKIVELCKQEDIPIMVVISPYVLNAAHQRSYNYLENIAEEYQVPFINYNSNEEYNRMGLDFSSDMADVGHLNYLGNVKYTMALGEDIQSYVQLKDHRGDEKYYSWEMNSKDINARIDDFLIAAEDSCDDLADLFDGSINTMYLYTISDTNDICMKTDMFNKMKVEDNLLQDGRLYVLDILPCRQISGEDIQWEYEEQIDNKWLLARNSLSVSDSTFKYEQSLIFDGRQYIDDRKGIYLFVYNRFTKSLVSVKQIRINEDGYVEMVNK